MRKTILVVLTLLFVNAIFAETICIKVDNPSPALFKSIANELKDYSQKLYRVETFNIDKATKTIKGERLFKVKKRNKKKLLIGTPVDDFRKKPKWKKEKIEITAKIEKNEICISVDLTAYNKRTRKWHKLRSDNLLEEHMASYILSKTLKGETLWSIGNITVDENGISKKILNLTKFKVDSVDISVDPSTGIKSVNFNLLKGNNLVVYKVLMIGDIQDVNSALSFFKSHFLAYNPISKTPKVYDYYWEYAKHGEIMDGMHKLQLITALGYPDKIVKKNKNTQIFVYNFDGKTYNYTLIKNELSLGD
ncbi:hypothetical protein TTHT_1099 [Thermotomaculum hydrothermale]|uniref:Uncharacterized protein n=1 Tax=Thermotomaculum hydrothermale TaxID=981385 RepID=A0A7R6PQT4_9BACT|nr:hypothetical protein [Thermotomaculum hydrothermale]BBB32636.1 hypothetical protein TTHT_1099 [Thermotomaculum hydrothermale]